jgi:hypothetical protein
MWPPFCSQAEGRAREQNWHGTIARARFDQDETADAVDLAGILWGISELLVLPRRSIELLGDDVASDALNTAAARIERGVREPAGTQPMAAAVRAALWPA